MDGENAWNWYASRLMKRRLKSLVYPVSQPSAADVSRSDASSARSMMHVCSPVNSFYGGRIGHKS